MLTTLNLKVGSILHDMEQNIDHRVIYMNKDYFVTILINGIKRKLKSTNGIFKHFSILSIRNKLLLENPSLIKYLTLIHYQRKQRKSIYATKILLKQSEISTDRATFA